MSHFSFWTLTFTARHGFVNNKNFYQISWKLVLGISLKRLKYFSSKIKSVCSKRFFEKIIHKSLFSLFHSGAVTDVLWNVFSKNCRVDLRICSWSGFRKREHIFVVYNFKGLAPCLMICFRWMIKDERYISKIVQTSFANLSYKNRYKIILRITIIQNREQKNCSILKLVQY